VKIFWFFSRDVDQFQSAETRALTRRPRWVLWLTLVSLVVFLVWAEWAEIDQITRAPGSVIASSKTQVVQSKEGGAVSRLAVKEGDRVERGDPLVYMDDMQAESSFLETQAKVAALLAVVSRLNAEVLGAHPDFPPLLTQYPQFVENQLDLFKKRQSALEAELTALEAMKQLVMEELQLNKPLIESGDVSKTEILRLERQVAELDSKQTNIRNAHFREAQEQLTKYQEELASTEQIAKQKKDRLKHTVLYAPANGVVKNISVTTEGGIIRAGDEILQIVPVDDALVIEAKVSPTDIAFLKTGLPATIKIDAYDYTIFGDLQGVLTYISADTLVEERAKDQAPYYRIQVQTQSNRFSKDVARKLEILPGMTATVEIKTGSNSVLHYLTKPLVKTLAESLGER
jgi:adhesin transport system membrane fusion protein